MINAQGIPLNCGSFTGDRVPVYQFKKPFFGLDNFKLIANPINRVISAASSGTIVLDDLELIRTSGSTIITDYETNIQQIIPGTYNISIYTTNSGVISSPNQPGIASGLSTGSGTLIAYSDDNVSFSSVDINVVSSTGVVVDLFTSYINGSVSKNAVSGVDSRIFVFSAEISKPIYSIQNHESNTYIRNTGCWINDIDLTCVSPWNSFDGVNKAGTLISPRHIIFAAHYQINNGAQIRFIDNHNNTITRTMRNKVTHPGYSPFYPDISIGILDSDVPESIKFAKILPSNWSEYLPSLSNNYRIPALAIDAEEKALVTDLYDLDGFASFIQPCSCAFRLSFFEDIILGDSGNPAFLIINNEAVIITIWTYGGSGRGTNISYHKDTINQLMLSLGGGYQLTEINLAEFTTFT